MFSRPVSSGCKPVPTSSRLAIRARSTTRPSVGSVIREMTFSRVLLPAPLRPTIPTTSPSPTLKVTSFRDQKCSRPAASGNRKLPRNRRSGEANRRASTSRKPRRSESRGSTYAFDKCSIWRIGCTSNNVGETPLHSPEDQQTKNKEYSTHNERQSHDWPWGRTSQKSIAKSQHHSSHRV